MIDILIDKLTPCLTEVATGRILQTTFSLAQVSEIKSLQKKGWNFDWAHKDLKLTNIYKLIVEGSDDIQGLVSAEVMRGAVYVRLVESAPHNLGKHKVYEGVGGHLFAIAMKLSYANGFGGFIFMDAKNMELVNHYQKMLGAELVPTRYHDFRLEVTEINAQNVVEKYTLVGDLNVN
jgi:hypothetical protein